MRYTYKLLIVRLLNLVLLYAAPVWEGTPPALCNARILSTADRRTALRTVSDDVPFVISGMMPATWSPPLLYPRRRTWRRGVLSIDGKRIGKAKETISGHTEWYLPLNRGWCEGVGISVKIHLVSTGSTIEVWIRHFLRLNKFQWSIQQTQGIYSFTLWDSQRVGEP